MNSYLHGASIATSKPKNTVIVGIDMELVAIQAVAVAAIIITYLTQEFFL